ncbi:SDR family oxidoreductase [Sphingomonas sp. BK580]|uniref:SDR family NAD(P)-dependent oxidoreductase n=1 Tax=Sphingomonas sp. BK580 TaxID=2586972 RepID=UPI0016188D36|nr:SDR family oxidoreductase [Sphingomonas sp. BK580]MBB3695243.1 gluconate 5-dehydrogenase [Sphingomonas sp. BK580]
MNHPADTKRLALVTGGSRGIGLACAAALARSGHDVVLVGRDDPTLLAAADGLVPKGVAVGTSVHDLADLDGIAPWFDRLCEEFGTPGVLINAAGITRRGLAQNLELADWRAVMDVNVGSIWELSRRFAARLIAQARPGRIVNIASLMTAAARAETSPYTASKGAVGQLTKALAVEWARHGILVNAVAPGYIATDLNQTLQDDPAFSAWVRDRCPLSRWGTPEDVAGPVDFLVGDSSRFITGQTIYVDGGWLSTF